MAFTETVPDDLSEVRGRYVHWDGGPETMGPVLVDLVRRDGFDVARRTVTDDNPGWSSVTGEDEPELVSDDGRFVAVPGYGVAYTTTVMNFGGIPDYQQARDDEWYTLFTAEDAGTEFFHVVTPETVFSYEVGGSGKAVSEYSVYAAEIV